MGLDYHVTSFRNLMGWGTIKIQSLFSFKVFVFFNYCDILGMYVYGYGDLFLDEEDNALNILANSPLKIEKIEAFVFYCY